MRIVIVTGPFLAVPPAPSGAVERIWQELAEEFAAFGHKVTFLSRAHPTQVDTEVIAGVRYLRRMRFARTSSLTGDLLKDLLYSLRMMAHMPAGDIVVTNAFWLPVMLTLLRSSVGKVVVNVARMPKGQMRLYARVARLAAVSNAVREAIVRESPRLESLVRVIPNPIDTAVFAPAPCADAADGQTVLFAGRLHPEKGLHLLVDAMRLLAHEFADVRLRIIGPHAVHLGGGGERYLERLKTAAQGLPVEFCEATFDKRRLADLYRSASVFCYPSLAEAGESFGLAPLEAMATGLPCLVSDLACFRDFLQHRRTGLVFDHRAPDPAATLSAALRDLLADATLRATLGAAAAQAAGRFGRRQVAQAYIDDFEQLLAPGR